MEWVSKTLSVLVGACTVVDSIRVGESPLSVKTRFTARFRLLALSFLSRLSLILSLSLLPRETPSFLPRLGTHHLSMCKCPVP